MQCDTILYSTTVAVSIVNTPHLHNATTAETAKKAVKNTAFYAKKHV